MVSLWIRVRGQGEHHHEHSGDLCLERRVRIGEEGSDAGVVVLDVGEQDRFVGMSEWDDKAAVDGFAAARPRDEAGQVGGPVAIAAQVAVEVCLGQVSEGSPARVEPAQ